MRRKRKSNPEIREAAKASLDNAVVTQKTGETVDRIEHLRKLFEAAIPQIADASLTKIPPEYLVSEAMLAIEADPKLAKCEPFSIINATLLAIQTGLRLNPVLREAHLVARTREGKLVAEFQPGYRGLLKTLRRSGQVRDVAAKTVRRKDFFEFEEGSKKYLRHSFNPIHTEEKRGPVIGHYAIVRLKGRGEQFAFWNVEKMQAFREEYGQNNEGEFSFWDRYPEEMAEKTMLINVMKLLAFEDASLEATIGSLIQLDLMQQKGQEQGIRIKDGRVKHNTPEAA